MDSQHDPNPAADGLTPLGWWPLRADQVLGRDDTVSGPLDEQGCATVDVGLAAVAEPACPALPDLPAGWTVLSDRLVRPGRCDAAVDHVVVGPGGAFLVDVRNAIGSGTGYRGGPVAHLTRRGRADAEYLSQEIIKVVGEAAYMSQASGLTVVPVLCVSGEHEEQFGAPRLLRGAWVVRRSLLAPWFGVRDAVLDADDVARALTRVMTEFPSTATDPELLAAIGYAAPESAEAGAATRGEPAATGWPPFDLLG